MKKFGLAGLVCLACIIPLSGQAAAMSLWGSHNNKAQSGLPIVKVQSGDAEIRVEQLEDQLRQLNGRIEEMSFQILQMQEQLRKTQEDNEFRFQDLEKSGSKKSGALEAPRAEKSDDVATMIETPSGNGESVREPAATGTQADSAGKPPQQLGSIEFDENGEPVGATLNDIDNGSAPIASGEEENSPSQTASLGGNDDYKTAYGFILSGNYPKAETEFARYIESNPQSSNIADANFWLGEALYAQGKYNEAAKTFLNAHQQYGTSEKAPEMLLKLGMSLAALDNKDTACATLGAVSKKYPKASRNVIAKVATEQKRLAC